MKSRHVFVLRSPRARVVGERRRRMRPRGEREQNALVLLIGRLQVRRAVVRERHRLRRGSGGVADRPDPIRAAVERLHVQRVLCREDAEHDELGGREHHRRVRRIGGRHGCADHLETRRVLVGEQIQIVAVYLDPLHLVLERRDVVLGILWRALPQAAQSVHRSRSGLLARHEARSVGPVDSKKGNR
jgi:hypothetical protein